MQLHLQCQYLLKMPWGVWELLFLTLLILNMHWRRLPQKRRLTSSLIFLSICNLCNLKCKKIFAWGQSPAKYFLCVAIYCIVLKKSNVTFCVLRLEAVLELPNPFALPWYAFVPWILSSVWSLSHKIFFGTR